jgi:hypothetical protein
MSFSGFVSKRNFMKVKISASPNAFAGRVGISRMEISPKILKQDQGTMMSKLCSSPSIRHKLGLPERAKPKIVKNAFTVKLCKTIPLEFLVSVS